MKIVEKALWTVSSEVVYIDDLSKLDPDDIVVVVNAKAHLQVLLKNRHQKVICWYQGIMPEELKVNYTKKDKWFKIILWTIFEYLSLRTVSFALFVSDRMKEHYTKKYKVSLDKKSYIMPCFNQELIKEAFFVPDKYKKATFVYAGTMSKWQCIDEMLSFFKKVESVLPEAELTIYTPEKDIAKEYIKKYDLSNVIIDYLPYQQLSKEIRKFKYGFLIRKDIEMNRVATPTKMNTYLANGIIPIYSDCVYAFRENLTELDYQLKLSQNDEQNVNNLLNLERMDINTEGFFININDNIFNSFYSSDYHIKNLVDKFKEELYK
ncbi:hypothetical protein [Lonepinella koalarum]|uniref:hypothetical protein n=1 Tax=Lonepinella koalarum TaxID=53417 RepID=UPI003F6DF3EA